MRLQLALWHCRRCFISWADRPASALCPLQVSSSGMAWLVHTLLLKIIFYMLGVPSGGATGSAPWPCSARQCQTLLRMVWHEHIHSCQSPTLCPRLCLAPAAVPLLELAAYAGYTFTAACASLLVQLVTGACLLCACLAQPLPAPEMSVVAAAAGAAAGDSCLGTQPCAPPRPAGTAGGSGTAYHAVWAYGSLCMAVFLVRTLKRVILQEARTYSE